MPGSGGRPRPPAGSGAEPQILAEPPMFTRDELDAAAALIAPHVPPTPQYAWPLLARRAGCEVWVKHENHTPAGAFKLRGGLVYAERLARERGQVAGIV